MSKKTSNIGPRDYKISEIKRLFVESHNQCAEPNCSNFLIAEDNITVIGKICHIEAANKNGPRFNEKMTNDQRRSYDNLILLCDKHHQVIDNPLNESKFKKERLLQWKYNHIKKNRGQNLEVSIDSIQEFINETKAFYSKIESLDGPYKPQLTQGYVERNIEQELIATLKKEKVLLLTGISFCGKSQTAFRIALDFYNQDYLYKRVLNTRDASSFLESEGKRRICILEDPFGHTFGDEKLSELKLVKDLLETLPEENLLIVTSKKEIVLSIFNQTNLSDSSLNGYQWLDLTVEDQKFLLDIWEQLIVDSDILPENESAIRQLIIEGNEIQPGQLYYLSKQKQLSSKKFLKVDLYKMAQVDIDDTCNHLLAKNDLAWKILALLGLGANTKYGLSINDFDYIFNNQKQKLSLEKKSEDLETYSFYQTKEFLLPEYDPSGDDISDIELALDTLEQSGVIDFMDDQYVFTHPHYQEIGKKLLTHLSRGKKRRLISEISNLLTCLNEESAFICANNIDAVFKNFTEQQSTIIEIVNEVHVNSIYPKVSDSCAQFLMSIYDNTLMEHMRPSLVFKLQSTSEEYKITFHNDKPYRFSYGDFFNDLEFISKDAYQSILSKLRANSNLSISDIWSGLLTTQNYGMVPNINFLEYAFKSSEVFIRNITAYLYFLNFNSDAYSQLKDKILTDEHPSVLFFALKGFFQGLHNNSKAINKDLSERFEYFFKTNKIFCIRASNLMTNFNTDYASDSISWRDIPKNVHKWHWRIWARLFVQFLKTFPKDVEYFHYARFSGTMNKAKDMIYPNQGQQITKQMLQRLKEISKLRILNHFEMHLIEFFIVSTKEEPSLRNGLFKKFFDQNLPTYFVGYNMVWTFGVWENLTKEEKGIVCSALSDSRSDKLWLQAMVLNNQIVPPKEIIETIFGNQKTINQNPKIFLEEIDQELIDKIITVYLGKDSAFEELGVSGSSNWVRNILYFIVQENLPYRYYDCVKLFLLHFINGIPSDEVDFFVKLWKEAYNNCSNKDKLLDTVINSVGRSSFCMHETTKIFQVIIDYHLDYNEGNFLATKLASNYQYLCYSNSDGDIFKLLEHKNFLNEFFDLEMQNQIQAFHLFEKIIENNLSSDEKEITFSKITEISNSEGLKLQWFQQLTRKLREGDILETEKLNEIEQILESLKEDQWNFFYPKTEDKKLHGFKYHYGVLSVKI
ncbi:hypothetical protein [Winogradskyella sp. SYSU M77433]|uniref:nSTAND3 domain-containing NTPase n=1 Tax=Winogradskyella sp. SYSU M77433 TaxID=3042722 RepID=UPI002480E916|nr:hypothetical protein [Winogradskyella sp. SYSU M77433]MDH7911360.1 hypothetical protein [Winogradskyella sp. SYSU M77433]